VRADDALVGNVVAPLAAPLPVGIEDPVEQYREVREATRLAEGASQAVDARTLTELAGFASPTIMSQAARLQQSQRFFNLVVTNVPGPQFPLYLLGREMQEIVPIAFLPEHHALAVAIMSYNGKVDVGLLADYDAMPDVDAFASHLEESLAELLAAAREAGRTAASSNGRKKDGAPGNARKKTTTS
jgi:hypothetical protein